jgi:NAD(P)-dependent dehydrogenase (short-subunit alcohol dehydrogenase family)
MPSSSHRPVAVITGGARGVGAAAARRFAALDHVVAVLDTNVVLGEAVVADLRAAGAQAAFHPCDVADAAAVDALATALDEALGPPAVLVTSAALIPNTDALMTMDLEAHDRMWRVNYHGTVHACRSFGRRMVEAGHGGAIVTIGSINSIAPMPLPAYNPSKAAIARMTQLLACELGRHGIRVNSVAPTFVMSPELQGRIDAGLRDLDKMMQVHALGALPTADDVAGVIAFLCSPAAATITGVLLPVDSGYLAAATYMTYTGGVPWTRDATG